MIGLHRFNVRRERSGFTLVELLVVIGIIALLISILLPALNKARLSANTVACQSNLRQIAQWGLMYAQENHDYLPTRGEAPTGSPDPYDTQYWSVFGATDWPVKSQSAGLFKGTGKTSGTPLHCPQAAVAVPMRANNSGNTYGLNAYLGGQRLYSAGVAPLPKSNLLKSTKFWFGDARPFASGGAWDFHSVLNISVNTVTPSILWPWNWDPPAVAGGSSVVFASHPHNSNNFVFGDGHVEGITRSEFMKWTSSGAQVKQFIGYPF